MADAQTIVITSGSYQQTSTGKDRWTLETADGRTLGCWAKSVYEAAMGNLGQPLVANISTRPRDGGGVWTTLHGFPALGIDDSAQRRQSGGGGGSSLAIDVTPVAQELSRIATALETWVGLLAQRWSRPTSPGPGWPDDEPPDEGE